MQGWIKLPREVTRESFWISDKPHCTRCAFIDLLLLASHSEHEMEFDMHLLRVAEGEIITSQLSLAQRWRWSRKKVQNFLKFLEEAGHIVSQTNKSMTRIRLCKWGTYQKGEVPVEQPKSIKRASEEQHKSISRAAQEQPKSTFNNDKKDDNVNTVENDKKKETDFQNLELVKAKKPENELTEKEKGILAECKALYQQMFKTQIDYNKLAVLVYGSEEDTGPHGFGDWQTLRKALGCLSRAELTYRVLHPYYYIWGLSREKDFVEKMKRLIEENQISSPRGED